MESGKDQKKMRKRLDNQAFPWYNKGTKRGREVLKMFVYLANGEAVKMTREQMLDNVIARYGFEAEETVDFAYLCEKGTNQQVAETYKKLMK